MENKIRRRIGVPEKGGRGDDCNGCPTSTGVSLLIIDSLIISIIKMIVIIIEIISSSSVWLWKSLQVSKINTMSFQNKQNKSCAEMIKDWKSRKSRMSDKDKSWSKKYLQF